MNKCKILVVEDDSSIKNLIVTTLKAHDYQYLVAMDGKEALLEASSHNKKYTWMVKYAYYSNKCKK